MRTAEQVTAHVDAAFMLLGNSIIEKQGQVQRRTNRRKACLIHGAAILRRQFCVFAIAAEPCSGDISKGSFHRSYLRYFNKKVQPKPHALSQSWERGRLEVVTCQVPAFSGLLPAPAAVFLSSHPAGT